MWAEEFWSFVWSLFKQPHLSETEICEWIHVWIHFTPDEACMKSLHEFWKGLLYRRKIVDWNRSQKDLHYMSGKSFILPVSILNNRCSKYLSWLIVSPQSKISELNYLLTFPVWIWDSVMFASCRFDPIKHSKNSSILIHLYSSLSSILTIILWSCFP